MTTWNDIKRSETPLGILKELSIKPEKQKVQLYKIDRTSWPAGPWDEEPEDLIEFTYKDMPGMIARNSLGAWCGYGGVFPEHPLYGKRYQEVYLDFSQELTFSGFNNVASEERQHIYWYGFDHAHSQDTVPSMLKYFEHMPGYENASYATKEQVLQETRELIECLYNSNQIEEALRRLNG